MASVGRANAKTDPLNFWNGLKTIQTFLTSFCPVPSTRPWRMGQGKVRMRFCHGNMDAWRHFQSIPSKLELMLPTFLFSDSQRRLTRRCVLQDPNRPTGFPRVHRTCVPDKYLITCCSQPAMMYKHCDFDGFPSAFPFLDWCGVENTSFYCCWQQGNSSNKWIIARRYGGGWGGGVYLYMARLCLHFS